LPSAQPDMTEACTVARVAGHLELEVMSTATGGHNHGHFQVGVSVWLPLSARRGWWGSWWGSWGKRGRPARRKPSNRRGPVLVQ
jgi:hypothetical protein